MPVDPPINVNTFNGANLQMSQAQILYYGDVNLAYGRRNIRDEPIPGCIVVEILNAISTPSRSSGIAGGLIDFLAAIRPVG